MSNTTKTVGPYTLESGVPMPQRQAPWTPSPRHAAFAEMKIGDSFHDPDLMFTSGQVIASRSGRKLLMKIKCRPDPEGGVRFWRIA